MEPYAENTVLTDVLGNHAKVKMIVALLSECDQDLNATELARLAGIDRSTFYEHIDDLLAYGIVEETRQVANSQMYQIDRDSDVAEDLAQLEWDLIEAVPDVE
jgi:DNA-binding transcriptional ArsR family regulator